MTRNDMAKEISLTFSIKNLFSVSSYHKCAFLIYKSAPIYICIVEALMTQTVKEPLKKKVYIKSLCFRCVLVSHYPTVFIKKTFI